MCKSCAEGGARCRDVRRLSSLTHSDLLPQSAPGRPDVVWSVGHHVEPELSELWEASSADRQLPRTVVAEAVGTLADIAQDEPAITTAVMSAVPIGASAQGLEFRVKSPSSLARKIHDRVKRAARSDQPKSPAEVAAAMTDIIRYTIQSEDHDSLVPTAKASIRKLTGQGFEVVEAEHSYVDGSGYKGLHLLLKSPTGRTFELQFHSQRSQQVKDNVHVLYEDARRMEPKDPGRPILEAKMMAMSDGLPQPAGIDSLRKLGGMTVQVRKK